jgi:hypothetical protein
MTANVGRTVQHYTELWLDNSSGTLTQVKINQIGDIGLDYPEVESYAFVDAVKGVLLDTPSFSVEVSGPLDTAVHTHLTGVNGVNAPLAFDFRFGIRHAWEAGEPTFGVTGTTSNGGILSNYKVTNNGTAWSARLSMYAGSAAPEWATAAHT